MPAAVEVVDIARRFGNVQALAGIDLSVAEGEFFGLLGPNGAGKTTLISIIAGLTRADRGTARILGPVVGAMLFWFLIEGMQSFLSEAVAHNFLGIGNVLNETQVGPVRFMLVGLMIMVLVIFRPQGILGSRREVMLSER